MKHRRRQPERIFTRAYTSGSDAFYAFDKFVALDSLAVIDAAETHAVRAGYDVAVSSHERAAQQRAGANSHYAFGFVVSLILFGHFIPFLSRQPFAVAVAQLGR